jgi:hypothetical protein
MILSEILHYWTRLWDANHVMVLFFGFVDYREDISILIFHKDIELMNITSEIIQPPHNSFFFFPLSHLQSTYSLNLPQRLTS